MDDGEEPSQDRQEDTPKNRREGQTLPLRQVPQAQPEACQDVCPLVLPQLLQARGRSGFRPGFISHQRLEHASWKAVGGTVLLQCRHGNAVEPGADLEG